MIEYRFVSREEAQHLGFALIGQNVLIHNSANIVTPARVHIGDNVRIDPFVTITGSLKLGSYVHIAAYCNLAGGAGIEMADFSGLSQRVTIYSTSDDYSGVHLTNPTVPECFSGVTKARVRLGRHVIIGAGSVILPGVEIGEGSAVGALSLVTKSLPPWGIYAGSPCRRLRERSKALLALEASLAAS